MTLFYCLVSTALNGSRTLNDELEIDATVHCFKELTQHLSE
jgi:hypothetical protein